MEEVDLYKRLVDVFTSPDYRPPALPRVGVEVIHLTYNPDIRFSDIVSVLESDPMVSGQILKLVRSPRYMGRSANLSLQQIVSRLGLLTFREAVWEIAFGIKLFRSGAFAVAMEQVRRHSHASAYITRILGRYSKKKDEQAFLCALLHDCGMAGALLILSDLPKDQQPQADDMWEQIDRMHAMASGHMARLWNLPLEVQMAVGHHHQFSEPTAPTTLEAFVCLADSLATELGCGVVPGADPTQLHVDRSPPDAIEAACEELGLDQAAMALIRNEAGDLVSEI